MVKKKNGSCYSKTKLTITQLKSNLLVVLPPVLGGCIRDPLSGRSYVYQAMRITGSGDPHTPLADTLEGKLPQKKITVEAARGYSSYGNQIGLATGEVKDVLSA